MNRKHFLSAIVLSLMACANTFSHEVDHYSLPANRNLVDFGPSWNNLLYQAVCKAVRTTNRDIRAMQHVPIPAVRQVTINYLHSPTVLTWRVRQNLPSALRVIEELEFKMRLKGRKDSRGRLLSHRPLLGTYAHAPRFPDPRHLNRILFMRSSLINLHGHTVGTDKIGHFVSMGFYYYNAYRSSRAFGSPHRNAIQHAAAFGKWGPFSEGALLGYVPTGIYSNADMAANYVGMKYYINVTQPVKLQGQDCPAMVVRRGHLWSLQHHVSPQRQYFARFVSPHFDEVLNPSVYEPGMRGQMKIAVQRRSKQILDWYVGNDANKNNRQYFDGVLANCKSYYGERYGHSGKQEELITIGQICFDEPPATQREVLVAQSRQQRHERRGSSRHTVTRTDQNRYNVCRNCQKTNSYRSTKMDGSACLARSLRQPAATPPTPPHRFASFKKEPPLPRKL